MKATFSLSSKNLRGLYAKNLALARIRQIARVQK